MSPFNRPMPRLQELVITWRGQGRWGPPWRVIPPRAVAGWGVAPATGWVITWNAGRPIGYGFSMLGVIPLRRLPGR